MHEAERRRILDTTAALAATRRANGRRNAHRLLRFLTSEAPCTRSELESTFLDLVEEARLPKPRVNTIIGGLEVDFAWREQRLIVEADGAADHHTRRAFEEDRRRDAALTAGGYRVVRISWRRLHDERDAVSALLRELLGP